MSRLIETIRLLDGNLFNLGYHQQRIDAAWADLYKKNCPWTLSDIISKSNYPTKGFFKARLVYDDTSADLVFEPYQIRRVDTLRIVNDNEIIYHHKFHDRTALNHLFEKRNGCDDVLIVKNGMVTDTSYANILFKKEGEWYTPSSCLLKGTFRQQLIDQGNVTVTDMRISDLASFEVFKLINSMLLGDGPEIPVSRILY